jgi:putative acetyltransferase
MYLDASLRGRGMGRQLLALALDHARAAGFRRMELETNHAMVAAIALYQGAGFEEIPAGGACAARCDRMFGMDLAAS